MSTSNLAEEFEQCKVYILKFTNLLGSKELSIRKSIRKSLINGMSPDVACYSTMHTSKYLLETFG